MELWLLASKRAAKLPAIWNPGRGFSAPCVAFFRTGVYSQRRPVGIQKSFFVHESARPLGIFRRVSQGTRAFGGAMFVGDENFFEKPLNRAPGKVSQRYLDLLLDTQFSGENDLICGAHRAIQLIQELGLLREECIIWDKLPDLIAANEVVRGAN